MGGLDINKKLPEDSSGSFGVQYSKLLGDHEGIAEFDGAIDD